MFLERRQTDTIPAFSRILRRALALVVASRAGKDEKLAFPGAVPGYGVVVNARVFFSASLAALTLLSVACGDDDSSAVSSADGGGGGGEAAAPVCATTPAPEKPAASCDVTIESPPISGATHVPEGTAIAYCSNPPSSGNHYPVWAAYQEYSAPVEWPYLVHSMEHGAVVLLYKCAPPGCPEIVEQLVKVRDNAAADPLCVNGGKRIIIAPSATITTKVAAAAWGKTYQAACVDMPTLEAFVRDNYAKGPENLCNPGRTF
ncbi:MAG: hypothetical protein BGO98_22425 [Myxococcales bacterium 68-20]|nr:MAG: hypothetical protein BGO98_22425 [Myxococcales bacterium 68-20]